MNNVVDIILKELQKAGVLVVEVSARHVHLSADDLETLFGKGAKLTPKRELSQPGQYLSEERITVIGPKGKKERTAILGPVRSETQVELSRTDCAELGIKAPLRESGNVKGSGAVTLVGPAGELQLSQGVIVAHNHIHLTPEDALIMGVKDEQRVGVEVLTDRSLVFKDVVIRVSERFRSRMHIDFDEANAAMVDGFTLGRIIK